MPTRVVDKRESRATVWGVEHHTEEETLVAHLMAKLNVFGRQLLVVRVEQEGWRAVRAAEAQGVSRATVYKWLQRHRNERADGLLDRSSRPHHSPRSLPAQQVELIVRTTVAEDHDGALISTRRGGHDLGAAPDMTRPGRGCSPARRGTRSSCVARPLTGHRSRPCRRRSRRSSVASRVGLIHS